MKSVDIKNNNHIQRFSSVKENEVVVSQWNDQGKMFNCIVLDQQGIDIVNQMRRKEDGIQGNNVGNCDL